MMKGSVLFFFFYLTLIGFFFSSFYINRFLQVLLSPCSWNHPAVFTYLIDSFNLEVGKEFLLICFIIDVLLNCEDKIWRIIWFPLLIVTLM